MQNFEQALIKDAPFSESCKSALLAAGFSTIGDVLALNITDIMQLEWFTPGMLTELEDCRKKLFIS